MINHILGVSGLGAYTLFPATNFFQPGKGYVFDESITDTFVETTNHIIICCFSISLHAPNSE